MIMKKLLLLLWSLLTVNLLAAEGPVLMQSAYTHGQFMMQNPQLKKYLFQEPKPPVYYGVGISPITIMNSKMYISANLFQFHWIKYPWDIEAISASMGMTVSQAGYASSRHFIFRSSPKYQIFGIISAGPLVGIEYIRFSKIMARMYHDRWVTPYDTFTTSGHIYGLEISETIPMNFAIPFTSKDQYLVKINQIVYKQNYSTDKAPFNWDWYYRDRQLREKANRSEFEPGTVYAIEFCILF
jgi:hypothetical protein